ncbi:hypothetical protein E1B28_012218 [Marasmius oreades]|uniref:ATP-dependent RNA helicase n=1 Tax=Marasmius oreades TaxID=181124 RepID=A0A9P7UPP5_9AGAR|nr:uncharacterized protein E1B28_012218 [Marasmius oreades]KAG7088201.1 hypothetical protein E1B28_012218 [Marasmius oreades]
MEDIDSEGNDAFDNEPVETEQVHFDCNYVPHRLLDSLSLPYSRTRWHSFALHPQLLGSLSQNKFSSPTPIQEKSLPLALKGCDIVGVAQMGSGKTLAYGLPILHRLLHDGRPKKKSKRPLRALILAPTRELALQVSSHLNMALNSSSTNINEEEDECSLKKNKRKGKDKEVSEAEEPTSQPPGKKPPPVVSIAAIVGGMSAQKQRRILNRGVDVLIATPGHLWDIMQEDDILAKEI